MEPNETGSRAKQRLDRRPSIKATLAGSGRRHRDSAFEMRPRAERRRARGPRADGCMGARRSIGFVAGPASAGPRIWILVLEIRTRARDPTSEPGSERRVATRVDVWLAVRPPSSGRGGVTRCSRDEPVHCLVGATRLDWARRTRMNEPATSERNCSQFPAPSSRLLLRVGVAVALRASTAQANCSRRLLARKEKSQFGRSSRLSARSETRNERKMRRWINGVSIGIRTWLDGIRIPSQLAAGFNLVELI